MRLVARAFEGENQMKRLLLAFTALAAVATVEARASVVGFAISGPPGSTISGYVVVSYGPGERCQIS
jgi:hypothetical protein